MLRAWAADATPILSRPISVNDFDNQTGALTFLYQLKGEGTHKIAALQPGQTLTVTGPCGNGFDAAALAGKYQRIAVVGGGIGTAPLLLLLQAALPGRRAAGRVRRLPRYQLRHGQVRALVPRCFCSHRFRQ